MPAGLHIVRDRGCDSAVFSVPRIVSLPPGIMYGFGHFLNISPGLPCHGSPQTLSMGGVKFGPWASFPTKCVEDFGFVSSHFPRFLDGNALGIGHAHRASVASGDTQVEFFDKVLYCLPSPIFIINRPFNGTATAVLAVFTGSLDKVVPHPFGIGPFRVQFVLERFCVPILAKIVDRRPPIARNGRPE